MPVRPAAGLAMSAIDWLLLIVLATLWGGSFFFAKIAVGELPPLTLALCRVGLAAFLLMILAVQSRLVFAMLRAWPSYLVMGLLNNVIPFSLIFWGQTHIPSGLASILNATTPLFTVLVAHVATADDKLTLARVVGLAAGFLGVVIMIGPDFMIAGGAHFGAEIACLLGALAYAFAGVYGRRFRAEPPALIAAGQLTASTLVLAPIAALVDRPWTLTVPSSTVLGAVVALAVLSTALAYVIYFAILARAGATNLLLVTFLIPVSAVLLGTLVLGERLAIRHAAGMLAIAAGLAAIDGRLPRLMAGKRRTRASVVKD